MSESPSSTPSKPKLEPNTPSPMMVQMYGVPLFKGETSLLARLRRRLRRGENPPGA